MSATKTTFSSNVLAQSPRFSTVPSPNSDLECYDYDIFLSFRGSDTRKKFTDHLYNAFNQEGLKTFRDENEIKRSKGITSELRKAIYSSRMSVIVLSKNYANSRSCLVELRTILDCREENSDHFVLPVFYEVDPSDIQKQAKDLNFGRPRVLAIFWKLLAYITTFSPSILARREEESVTLKGWTVALEEVSNIAGMVSQNQCDGYEANLIKKIVADIKSKLSGKHLRVADHLVRMGKNILPLAEINLASRSFTIEVIVVEKEMPKLTSKRRIPCQQFVLQDAQGTRIQATIFGANIATFEDTLKMYHTYSITNPGVSKTPEGFQLLDTTHRLTIDSRTPVEEIYIVKYNFTPISHLNQLDANQQTIDMVFAIVQTTPKRAVKNTVVADVQIVDQSLQPMILSLWDRFAEYELEAMTQSARTFSVVVAIRLKTSTFYGSSLATNPSSTFLFNPIIPEAIALQSWCDANIDKIKELPHISTPQQDALAMKEQPLDTFTKIEDLPATITQPELFKIDGIVQVTDFNQGFYDLACSICKRTTSAYSDEQIWCNSCKQKVNILPRLKFNVQISDPTGSKDATIFSDAAQALYNISDADIDLNATMLTATALQKLAQPIQCTVTLKGKGRTHTYRDVPELRFNIHRVLATQIQDEPKLLLMDPATQVDESKNTKASLAEPPSNPNKKTPQKRKRGQSSLSSQSAVNAQ